MAETSMVAWWEYDWEKNIFFFVGLLQRYDALGNMKRWSEGSLQLFVVVGLTISGLRSSQLLETSTATTGIFDCYLWNSNTNPGGPGGIRVSSGRIIQCQVSTQLFLGEYNRPLRVVHVVPSNEELEPEVFIIYIKKNIGMSCIFYSLPTLFLAEQILTWRMVCKTTNGDATDRTLNMMMMMMMIIVIMMMMMMMGQANDRLSREV